MATVVYENSGANVCVTGTVTGINTSEIIPMDFIMDGYTIQINPTAGNAAVYASNNGDNWVIWDVGSVGTSTIDSFLPVKFIRITNTTSTETSYTIWGF
jgi:hypothetical protein